MWRPHCYHYYFQAIHIQSSISVSVDFVSPENVSHTYRLTKHARLLPQVKELPEDRLQVKNLIFHSVKDALAVLQNKQQ